MRKSVLKRIKLTKNNKVLSRKSGIRHSLTKKLKYRIKKKKKLSKVDSSVLNYLH